MARKKKKIDGKDLEIVRLLWDGRTPYSDIAEKVGLTTNTVRARANRMIKEGILQVIGLVDPAAIPGHSSAFIGIKAEANKIDQVAKQFMKLKGVVISARVSGRFDVMATVMFNESCPYSDFISQELVKVKGIISIETFFVVEGEQFNLRYVL